VTKKIFFILSLFALFSINTFGQVTIWSEDFESYNDNFAGPGYDNNNPPAGNDWTIVDASPGNTTIFRVESNDVSPISGNRSFVGRDTDGEATWLSETIDISAYSNISLSVNYHETGGLENTDRIYIEYSLDGGSWTTFNNGSHQNDMNSGIETATASVLSGTSIQVRVRMITNRGDEAWYFDDIIISGYVPDCSWSLCLVDDYGDGWNGGSVDINVNGTSVGSWTLSNGSGPYCIDIPIMEGDNISVIYNNGWYPEENEYYLLDSHGNLIRSEGTGNTTPADYTHLSADCSANNISPNEQDCLGAIPICGDSYNTAVSYSGTGNIPFEINYGSSCLRTGEKNDVWYVFTVQQDGDLMFTISPHDSNDDYDWAVFNLTNASCSEIATDPSLEVSCNYSDDPGDTGPDGTSTFSSQGAGGTAYNAAIPVLQNEVYVINVSNYSSSQSGYYIDFSMASGVIVDVTPPELQSIVNAPTCGQSNLTLWYTENVDTTTVGADDFTITGPGGSYSIINASGNSNTATDREYALELNTQLIAGGTYTLTFSGQVDDACGNTVIGNSLDFTVAGVSGSTLVDDGNVLCYDDAQGSITASATGGSGNYSYSWSTGSNNQTINNLTAGTYTVTVNDDVGVCYDIVNATVNSSNPFAATGEWAGTSNSNWNDCENWGGGRIPNSSHDVVIPSGCTNYPTFGSNITFDNTLCHSIVIEDGGSISVNNNKNLTLQNFSLRVNTGGQLNITRNLIVLSSSNLFVSGGTVTVGNSISTNASVTMLSGEIQVEGNIANNNTFNCLSGEVILNGSGTQILSGSIPFTFYDLSLDNASGAMLLTNTMVNNKLTFINGNLNITDKEVDLGTTGTLVNETEANRIVALDGLGIPMNGGTIKTTRTNPNSGDGNIAGLGIKINPSSALGNTIITRGHDLTQGTGAYTGNYSIARYYTIESDNRASIPTDIEMSYFDSELMTHIDGTLVMYQEVEHGAGPVYLQRLTTVNDGVLNTAFSTSVANNLSPIKVTLGSTAQPLPVTLTDFVAKCNGQEIEIIWETAAELNNAYYTLEKSSNGIDFQTIEYIDGYGNSNKTIRYNFIDHQSIGGKSYYRLSQTDFDGTSKELGIIITDCSNENSELTSMNLYPNPVEKESALYIDFNTDIDNTDIQIIITNMLGQTVLNDDVKIMDRRAIIKSGKLARLAQGTYLINAYYNNQIVQEKLIIK
jgi:hypothetical protein